MDYSIEELKVILKATQEKLARIEQLKNESENETTGDNVALLGVNYDQKINKLKNTLARVLANLFHLEHST